MGRKNYLYSLTSFSLALSVGFVTIASTSTLVRAQSNTQNLGNRNIARITFEPPNSGAPQDTVGGASRGSGQCDEDVVSNSLAPTPLMPAVAEALTVAERPTLFVYMPETSVREVFFSLEDENNTYHYQTKLPISGEAGIMSVKLPNDAPPLQVGTQYKWSLVMMCGQRLRPDSPAVQGSIRRIEPQGMLQGGIGNGSALESAALYGEAGVWYDMLASLAEARRSQPNDPTLAATWSDLLTSVGLEAIAAEPLLQ